MRILALLLLLFIFESHATALPPDSLRYVSPAFGMPAHPRLLMTATDESAVRRNIKSSQVWRGVHDRILHQSDSLLNTQPVERVLFGVRLLAKSRDCLFRIFHLAYAWRLTGEKKYFIRAEKELLAVSAFSDWNPKHYLDVAEMTMAVAIGYDWLYKDLTETSRKIVREAILTKGIATSYDPAYPNESKWLSVTNNWNQVCNAGISFGALAVFEDDPTLGAKVLNRSIASIAIPMDDYGPDGAFAEGYTYWGYGTTFNILFLSAIEKIFKSDFGLSEKEGFRKTAGYLEHVVGPTGKCFNYSDATEKAHLQPAMFWFASRFKDPTLLWSEQNFISEKHLNSVSDRILPAIMVWGNDIAFDKITPPQSRSWVGQGKNPVALMRSSWTKPDALYAAIKGGSPFVTHGHMDVGSFVMESGGVRWAIDLGMQDYTPLELKNIDLWANEQKGQRWEIFRYNNFSHNTLTINNTLQKVDGNAVITSASATPAFMQATVDLSELYQGLARKTERGIAIVDEKYVVVRDEITAGHINTTVRWSMLTAADVQILNDSTAELSKNGKQLTLRIQASVKTKLQTWTTDPPRDYDDANPGTIRVGFEMQLPPGDTLKSNVFLIPENENADLTKPVDDLSQWKLK
jgi:hypothetical protein